MTINEQDRKNLGAACCGNQEAMDFLTLWSDYVNLIDDIIDEDLLIHSRANASAREGSMAVKMAVDLRMRGAERVCQMGAMATQVYSHPFYLKNLQALRQIALNCTNAYMDSVRWEASAEDWKREWADHYRHFGAEMVLAVAGICGGYQQMRKVSEMLRVICWQSHHDQEGKVV